MGDTIWVDVEDRDQAELPVDNSIILKLEPQLRGLSDKLKVARLADFYGRRGWLRSAKWFDPLPALAAVNAIYDHLLAHPDDLDLEIVPPLKHWPASLMKELLECRRALTNAISLGKKFRFLIVS